MKVETAVSVPLRGLFLFLLDIRGVRRSRGDRVSVPLRGLFLFLRSSNQRRMCRHCCKSFSPLTGIVFISTIQRRKWTNYWRWAQVSVPLRGLFLFLLWFNPRADDGGLMFQSPYGDCFYFYTLISIVVVVSILTFQSPYGDCFYFYDLPILSYFLSHEVKFQSPYGDCFYFYLPLLHFLTISMLFLSFSAFFKPVLCSFRHFPGFRACPATMKTGQMLVF